MKADEQSCKGFLISCDKNREKQALRDAQNFISEHIEAIYSDVMQEHIRKRIKQDGKEVSLETEVLYSRKANAKLLTQLETNVNCICFLKINPLFAQIDPLRVVAHIMKQVHEEGRQVTRFCHRILPVERAFKAQHFRMIQELQQLILQHSQDKEVRSWMLNFKCRNNAKFNYKEVLKEAEKIAKKHGHFVDIYYPQWTISVEISNHLMCLSIAQHFKETNEFKLHKKIHKIKYSKEDDDERQRLNRQVDEHERWLAMEKEEEKRQERLKKKQEEREQKHQGECVLMEQKIELKQDEIDLF